MTLSGKFRFQDTFMAVPLCFYSLLMLCRLGERCSSLEARLLDVFQPPKAAISHRTPLIALFIFVLLVLYLKGRYKVGAVLLPVRAEISSLFRVGRGECRV